MFSRIYFEKEALEYPRAKKILERYKNIEQVECNHYGEVFNLKNQNFRVQKQKPALIIAKKTGAKILKTPEGFGVGGEENYYFSHMQNCLYDCRYCFLQGMYSSANYVWFVNYEDFFAEIKDIAKENNGSQKYFFSGYDCDSLAMESLTSFTKEFLPFFNKLDSGILELRTKSVNVKSLEEIEVVKNTLTAFSFTPEEISKEIEHKVPPLKTRIKTIQKLAKLGWQVGLRFDPLIWKENYKSQYRELFEEVFNGLNLDNLHSISIGSMRFPKKMYAKISKLYPEESFLKDDLIMDKNIVSYNKERDLEMKDFVTLQLKKYVQDKLIFTCSPL
jgi:spore photoproduct lyase